MKLGEIIENLQKENPGYIILIRSGIFYIGVGKDALILKELLGLKQVCFSKNVCRVGIPADIIKKYEKELINLDCTYVIYDYSPSSILEDTKEDYKEVSRNIGRIIREDRMCIDCNKCWFKQNKINKQIDESLEKIERLLEYGQ